MAYYTTENTIKSLIAQMDSLSFSTLDYYLTDNLRIYPLAVRSSKKHTEKRFQMLVSHFTYLPKQYVLIIVDSITLLLAHGPQYPEQDTGTRAPQ